MSMPTIRVSTLTTGPIHTPSPTPSPVQLHMSPQIQVVARGSPLPIPKSIPAANTPTQIGVPSPYQITIMSDPVGLYVLYFLLAPSHTNTAKPSLLATAGDSSIIVTITPLQLATPAAQITKLPAPSTRAAAGHATATVLALSPTRRLLSTSVLSTYIPSCQSLRET